MLTSHSVALEDAEVEVYYSLCLGSSELVRAAVGATTYGDEGDMLDADVIVVGAGPVGMLAALLSAQQGLKVLLLEQSVKRVIQSRAIGITPPSLEMFRRLGLSKTFIEQGISVQVSEAYDRKKFLGQVDFTKLENEFQFVLSIPQDRTESLLEEAIVNHPFIHFLRGYHVTKCFKEGCITVSGCRTDAGRFNFSGQYVFACDGGKSTLREAVGISFDGAPEPYTFLMGDFEDNTGWGTQARLILTARGSVESFPLPGGKRRYIVRTPFFIKEYTTDYLKAELLWRAGINVEDVRQFWESGFGVQRFMARTFCKGRVFLCGDSAHLMSPIGGQNMNAGFADAELAAWLSRVLIEQRAPHHLVCRLYNRVRKRAAGVSVRRAHVMMLAGTSGGRAWSAIRSVAVLIILHTPIRRFLAQVFSMQSIPGCTLKNYQRGYEKELRV